MEIYGKIIAALPVREGTSSRTGSPWKSQEFVLETHDQYPRRCCFNVFGEDRLREWNIQVGEDLTISFDIDAREYQGRWYNSIRAWKVVRGAVAAPTAAAPMANIPAPELVGGADIPAPTADMAPAAPAENTADEDLPF